MQVKNISARGWMIDGTFLKPGETAEIDDGWHAAIKDNAELVVIGGVEAPQYIGEVVVEAQETKEVEQEKRKPGRPAK